MIEITFYNATAEKSELDDNKWQECEVYSDHIPPPGSEVGFDSSVIPYLYQVSNNPLDTVYTFGEGGLEVWIKLNKVTG